MQPSYSGCCWRLPGLPLSHQASIPAQLGGPYRPSGWLAITFPQGCGCCAGALSCCCGCVVVLAGLRPASCRAMQSFGPHRYKVRCKLRFQVRWKSGRGGGREGAGMETSKMVGFAPGYRCKSALVLGALMFRAMNFQETDN